MIGILKGLSWLKLAPWFALAFALYSGGLYAYAVWKTDASVRKEWALQTLQDRIEARDARDSAEASSPELTEEDRKADAAVPPRRKPCRVPDKWDRDCRGL
jgi:hypothetical protein